MACCFHARRGTLLTERSIQLRNQDESLKLYGERDRYLKMVRNHFNVRISARGGHVKISGDEQGVTKAQSALLAMLDTVRRTGRLFVQDVDEVLHGSSSSSSSRRHAIGKDSDRHRSVSGDDLESLFAPKTPGQDAYVKAMKNHAITFGIGPAGSGKTYLAVGQGVTALLRGDVKRLVLVRPAVEAGEKLGFLPGDFQAKVNPYLRPIFDAIGTALPRSQVQQYMDNDIIEIAPLAFMRGRTLHNAFVILDEAQNCTPKQMLMLLTRLGKDSRAVITGDMSQTDLPNHERSGLDDAVLRLRDVPGIAICRMGRDDIVRHSLVQKIVAAYEPSVKDHLAKRVHSIDRSGASSQDDRGYDEEESSSGYDVSEMLD